MSSFIEIECFYRNLPLIKYSGCTHEADYSFKPYDIFMLETRVYPYIYNLINEDIELYLKGVYDTDRDKIVLRLEFHTLVKTEDPYIVNPPYIVSEDKIVLIKKKIEEYTSKYINYALIDIKELYRSLTYIYPYSWYVSILPYIGITSEYNPFIKPEGIYLTFNPISDYKTAYYEVVKFISDRIEEFYQNGVIVIDNGEELAKEWKLERVDTETILAKLYQPTWTDLRFASNPVDFLMGKISKDPYIKIKVSLNLVQRHFIAINLINDNYNFIFEGSMVKIKVNNIDDAQHASALVTSGIGLGVGRVLVLSANRLSWIYLFGEAVRSILGKDVDHVSYKTSDVEAPYTFSVLIPININKSYTELQLEFRNYALTKIQEISKIKKFTNKSPHDLIEEEKGV